MTKEISDNPHLRIPLPTRAELEQLNAIERRYGQTIRDVLGRLLGVQGFDATCAELQVTPAILKRWQTFFLTPTIRHHAHSKVQSSNTVKTRGAKKRVRRRLRKKTRLLPKRSEEREISTKVRTPRVSRLPAPKVNPDSTEQKGKFRAGSLADSISKTLGTFEQALSKLQAAGSISNLHAQFAPQKHYASFRSALLRLYGKSFLEASRGKRGRKPATVKPKLGFAGGLIHTGAGIVARQLIQLYHKHRDWNLVATDMNNPLEEIRGWAKHHQNELQTLGQEALIHLLNAPVPTMSAPIRSPEVHPSGIHMTKEAMRNIAEYCKNAGISESELFSTLYDPDPQRTEKIAEELGIGVGLYEQLVVHFRGSLEESTLVTNSET